jgi:protein TonB
LRADDPSFLEATRKQALAKWRFLPATRDGQPVESWREMTVRFELPG